MIKSQGTGCGQSGEPPNEKEIKGLMDRFVLKPRPKVPGTGIKTEWMADRMGAMDSSAPFETALIRQPPKPRRAIAPIAVAGNRSDLQERPGSRMDKRRSGLI